MDNIGEVLFLAQTMELGLIASRPYAPCKYDFVVDNGSTLMRVQVKMITATRPTESSGDVYVGKIGSGTRSKTKYTKKDVDFLATDQVEPGKTGAAFIQMVHVGQQTGVLCTTFGSDVKQFAQPME